jgi:hypothetical protein
MPSGNENRPEIFQAVCWSLRVVRPTDYRCEDGEKIVKLGGDILPSLGS